MLQLIQYQKTGEIVVAELPAPSCPDSFVLVRNASSLISAGTEKISVDNAKASLIERARRQPDQVKLVMDYVRKEGLASTFKRVKSKIDSYKFLGYSSAGTVIESKCPEFSPGDRVACAGAGYAMHAEIVAVPKNLAALMPPSVSFSDAAYTTLGAIALQSVRQADLKLGENCAVIGLGLLGQITVQLLKASGVKTAGIDINKVHFENAKKFGCDATYPSNSDYVKNLFAFADNEGFDAVIIAASSNSNQPIELALDITRKKGRIIVLGAVNMDIPRAPFYLKEIDLKISSSYGPGRYDASYEEQGIDYPYAYVRWTENRNMKAIISLIADGKLDFASMTTHNFDIKNATEAYELISGTTKSPYLGIIINYPQENIALKRSIILKDTYKSQSDVRIGFLGAGNFAQNYLLPHLKATGADFVGVSTSKAANSFSVAKLFGFSVSSVDSSELIENKDINTIFCATRHDTHSKYVIEAIKAGKPVFVEKPLAISSDELENIAENITLYNGRIMVGYNRRFSASFNYIKEVFAERKEPMAINYRINAGFIAKDHWVHNQGGRIIGEVCHFIDCINYLTEALPQRIYAENTSSGANGVINRDNVIISMKYDDGSVANISYFANGGAFLSKEYCEIYCEGISAVMNDFKTVDIYRNNNVKNRKFDGTKGHKEEVFATIEAIKQGKQMPISINELYYTSKATFAIIKSLENGIPVYLNSEL